MRTLRVGACRRAASRCAIGGAVPRLVARLGQERRRLGRAAAPRDRSRGAPGGRRSSSRASRCAARSRCSRGSRDTCRRRRTPARSRRQAVGDLMRLSVGDRVHEDRAQMAVEALRVRDPLRVGRPRGVEVAAGSCRRRRCRSSSRFRVATSIVQRFRWLSSSEQLLAVRRPREARSRTPSPGSAMARGLREAGLVADHELVFAARVGEPGELRAVGRPHRARDRARRCSA